MTSEPTVRQSSGPPAQTFKTQAYINIVVRKLSPADREQYVKLISSLSPSDRRFRFITAIKELPNDRQGALTDLDQNRHIAFGAEKFQPGSDPTLCGVVRLVKTEIPSEAEFAIVVEPDHRNCGLGHSLMEFAIAYARYYGFSKITGSVHSDNLAMLSICQALGFRSKLEPGNPSIISVTLIL